MCVYEKLSYARIDGNLKLSQNEKLPQVKLSPVGVLLCYGGCRCLYGCLVGFWVCLSPCMAWIVLYTLYRAGLSLLYGLLGGLGWGRGAIKYRSFYSFGDISPP